MQHKNFKIFIILLIIFVSGYSQEQKLDLTIEKAKKMGLESIKVEALKRVYIIHSEKLKFYKKERDTFSKNSILYLNSQVDNERLARLNFKREISKILTLEEFGELFEEQLETYIKNDSQKRYDAFLETYPLINIGQQTEVRNISYEASKNQTLARMYYGFDKLIQYKEIEASKKRFIQKKNLLLESFGLMKRANLSNPKIKRLIAQAKTYNLSPSKIDSLLYLIAVRDEKKEAYPAYWSEGTNKYAIFYVDQSRHQNETERQFQEDLAQLISLEQFTSIFKEQFEHYIKKETEKKLKWYQSTYEFKEKQFQTLQKVVYENTEKETLSQKYYLYNSKLAYKKGLEIKEKSKTIEKDLLKKFRLKWKASVANSSGVALLVTKAKKIGLSEARIDRLLIAIAKRDDQIAAYPSIWAKNNEQYVLNFHDKSTSKEEAHRLFKKDLAQILSTQEFEALFVSQLQSQINREAEGHLQKSKRVYNFGGLEETDLRTLLVKHYTKRIIFNEYYEYDWTLRSQKLKVIDFKFQKEYRKMIEGFRNDK